MTHYNSGITGMPSLLDISTTIIGFVSDFAQVVLGNTQTSFSAAILEDSEPGEYDAVNHCWKGTGGLTYRVPLIPVPSGRHAHDKTRNIKILMDNCRQICVNDELPSTPEEMKFWVSYRYMKYQMILAPACVLVPPTYVVWRILDHRLPRYLRGRTLPLTLGVAFAEQWAEATYPGQQFLATALQARTPMGDAARAEWMRLQPVDIPFYLYTAYQVQHFFGNTPQELLFGGDAARLCG